MIVFFDTSSLFKLYHKEQGTQELMEFFTNKQIDKFYLAEITKIEFSSVVWKKCRKGDLDESKAIKLIEKFDFDNKNFSFVSDTPELKNRARKLIALHWKEGLRTLDSIQLASGLIIREEIDFYFTSDILLAKIADSEGLNIFR